jgi:hypothetical protein
MGVFLEVDFVFRIVILKTRATWALFTIHREWGKRGESLPAVAGTCFCF